MKPVVVVVAAVAVAVANSPIVLAGEPSHIPGLDLCRRGTRFEYRPDVAGQETLQGEHQGHCCGGPVSGQGLSIFVAVNDWGNMVAS